MYEVLARESATFAFSPYSIAVALAMTAVGARGETLAEIERAMAGGQPQALVAGHDEVRLDIANSLWAQDGLRLERSFVDTLADVFGGGVELVDYRTDPDGAREAINEWVAVRTQGKIRDLLGEGTISEATRLTLVNAIYFMGKW